MKAAFVLRPHFLLYFLLLVLSLCNHSTILNANTTSPILIQIKPPSQVLSKSHFSLVIQVANQSDLKQTIHLNLDLPSQWKNISSNAPLTLAPKSNQTVFKTIYVPSQMKADQQYIITVKAQDSDLKTYISKKIDVNVEERIDARITWNPPEQTFAQSGSNYTQIFQITNTGNKSHTFQPRSISTIPWDIRIDPPQIYLKPKESTTFKAIVRVPKTFQQEILHQFHIEIPSKTSPIQSNVARMHVMPKIKNRNFYEQAEITIKNYISGMGTGTKLAPQTRIQISGDPTNDSHIEASYQGPFYGERVNARSIGEEKYHMHYQNESLDWHWGDHSLNLSELLYTQQGRGHFITWNPPQKPWSVTGLSYQDETGQSLHTEYKTAQVDYQILPFWTSSYTYSEDEDLWGLANQGPDPQKKQHQSLNQTVNMGELWSLSYEIAHSNEKNTFGSQKNLSSDYAHYSRINYQSDNSEQYLSFINGGSQFEGPWSNSKQYQYFSRYSFNSKFVPYFSYTHSESSTAELSDISTPKEETYELGNQVSTPFWGNLFTNYLFTDSTNTNIIAGSETNNNTSSTWSSNWSKSILQWLSINLRGRFTDQNQRKNKAWGTSLSITRFPLAISLTHDRTYSETFTSDSLSQQHSIGVSYQLPNPNISFDGYFTINDTKQTERDKDHHLQLSMEYRINTDHNLRIEFEKRDSNITDTLGKWRGYLSWQRKFHVMIPWRSKGARIVGQVFADFNQNGVFDKEDKAISGAVIRSGQFKAISNANGEYRLQGLPMGNHLLGLEPASFPINLSAATAFPHKITINNNKTQRHSINLYPTLKTLSGVVIKKPSRFDWQHTEDFPYKHLQLNLYHQNGQLFKLSIPTKKAASHFTTFHMANTT